MPNIGVVLAGGASKGAYEIGCLRAIEAYFGKDSIKCVSSASIGALVAQTYGLGITDVFERIWKNINLKEHGHFILALSGDQDMLNQIGNELDLIDRVIPFEHYVSVWNFTQRKVEYIPFHTLTKEKIKKYIRGAIAIPFFSKGELIDGDRIIDGAFLDNIPAYPLLDKDLDYIFCIYFDNYKYFFETEEFNKKIIKLFDFPNDKRLEILSFNPGRFDGMVEYGYDYATNVIKELFRSGDKETIYQAIAEQNDKHELAFKPRLTADIVLNNINVMTRRYSRRMSRRTKEV